MVVTKGHIYLNKPVALIFAPLYLSGIAHQGCSCALFRGICRASATSKIELFVTLLNDFQSLTNVTKNYILDVMGVLDPSLLLCIKMLFQNIDTQCITNWKGNRRSSWKTLWIKRSPYDLFKKGSWSLWSKSVKNSVKGFILIKKNLLTYFSSI